MLVINVASAKVMNLILSTIIFLVSAVSPVAESKQFFEAIDQGVSQLNDQASDLINLQAKNPPCDPIRCY